MYLARSSFMIILLISIVFPQDALTVDPPYWNPAWPMFYNSTILEQCGKGYGDWCPSTQGPHNGIDFDASGNENPVLAPLNVEGYSGGCCQDEVNPDAGYVMCFLLQSNDDYGWGIGHLDINQPSQYAHGINIAERQLIEKAIPEGPNWPWRHIHLSWVEIFDPGPSGPLVGLANPFDYLQAPTNYDYVFFRPIPWLESPNSGSGLWFTLDGIEDPNSFPGDINLFQNVVWGIVDMIVYPRSSWYSNIIAIGAGVRSISHTLKRQDPYSGWSA